MTRTLRILACSLAVAALMLPVACSRAPSAQSTKAGTPPRVLVPDLRTPEASVRTYLSWMTLAYRLANSDTTTKVASAWENVRIDSYIQMNREQGRGIEQELTAFEVVRESREGTKALVATREDWRYRYFSLTTLDYIGAEHSASYDTTYTLIREASGWLVDEVDARPLGTVE